MIHTYRDPHVLKRRFFGPLYLGFMLLVLIFLAGPWAFSWSRDGWTAAGVSVGVVLFVLIHQYFAYRHHHYGICGEIRLSDDGTCELETKRRVIRLHVNEIRSVKYWPEDSETSEHYAIHYQGGTLGVTKRMTDFRDFLTCLKTLNPAVELSSFPADAWPGLEAPATEERGTLVNRFFRGALFPLIVVSLLVYLASQTLLGK